MEVNELLNSYRKRKMNEWNDDQKLGFDARMEKILNGNK